LQSGRNAFFPPLGTEYYLARSFGTVSDESVEEVCMGFQDFGKPYAGQPQQNFRLPYIEILHVNLLNKLSNPPIADIDSVLSVYPTLFRVFFVIRLPYQSIQLIRLDLIEGWLL
jgi:hypothetical protein